MTSAEVYTSLHCLSDFTQVGAVIVRGVFKLKKTIGSLDEHCANVNSARAQLWMHLNRDIHSEN
jgi:hypothetical protein